MSERARNKNMLNIERDPKGEPYAGGDYLFFICV
jgi:hypothetical protein